MTSNSILFNDQFIDELSPDRSIAIHQISERLFKFLGTNGSPAQNNYEVMLEALAIIQEYMKAHSLEFNFPTLSDSRETDSQLILKFFQELYKVSDNQLKKTDYEKKREHFALKFNSIFNYEFSQGDLDRIQSLINEIRSILTDSEKFEEKYKSRLLKRLEKFQSELHKKVSDLDRFWGVVGEAGVALGKFGTDAKPLIDRFREIAEIVWRTQSRAEELPSGTTIPVITLPTQIGNDVK